MARPEANLGAAGEAVHAPAPVAGPADWPHPAIARPSPGHQWPVLTLTACACRVPCRLGSTSVLLPAAVLLQSETRPLERCNGALIDSVRVRYATGVGFGLRAYCRAQSLH